MTGPAPVPAGGVDRLSFNCFNHSAYFGLDPSLPGQITAAAAAGYDLVGLDVASLTAHEATGLPPQAIRQHLDEAGVACYELVLLPLGLGGAEEADQLDAVARLCGIVGARCVLATVRGERRTEVADDLRRAADRLAGVGASVAVEFMGTTPGLATLEAAVELVGAVPDHHVGIVVDLWHLALSGDNWGTWAELPADRIGFVQLCDGPRDALGDSLEDSLDRRLLPGHGTLPVARFRDALAAKGYDGVVSVEVLSSAWRRMPPESFAEATYRASVRAWGIAPPGP